MGASTTDRMMTTGARSLLGSQGVNQNETRLSHGAIENESESYYEYYDEDDGEEDIDQDLKQVNEEEEKQKDKLPQNQLPDQFTNVNRPSLAPHLQLQEEFKEGDGPEHDFFTKGQSSQNSNYACKVLCMTRPH